MAIPNAPADPCALEDVFVSNKPASHDLIDPLTPQEADDSKTKQSSRGSPEPPKIVDILAGDLEVAAEHTCHDVHWEDDRSEDGQFAEHVGCLDKGKQEVKSRWTVDLPFPAVRSCGC